MSTHFGKDKKIKPTQRTGKLTKRTPNPIR
jgi:hypothetical protein